MQIKVIVLGKVSSPGTVYLPEGSQVLDVIAQAGGTAGRAAVGNTYIIRVVESKPVVIRSDLKALINRAELKENVEVKDGDIVFVPETSRIDIRSILGDLAKLNLLKTVVDQIEERE